MSTPLERTVAEESGTAYRVLSEHVLRPPTMGDSFYRCSCGRWGVAWRGTAPRGEVEVAHRAHLAAVLTRVVEAEVLETAAEAWERGHGTTCDGIHDKTWSLDGCEQHNPYRDRARGVRGGGS